MPQPQNLVVFFVWLTQAVTLSRSALWQVCGCMRGRQHTGQTMSQMMAAFRERFNKAPPRRVTLLDWEKGAPALGSVKDRLRSGRKTTRLETCAAVGASIERSAMKSTRKRSSELGVPRSTMRHHMKKDLNVRPYRPTFLNDLWDGDMDRRYESCRALLDIFTNAVSRSKVLLSDECAIYRRARDRNVVFCSKENPNFTQQLEHNPSHVMIWAGMTSDYLIGPYVFRWTDECGILFGNVGDVAHTLS